MKRSVTPGIAVRQTVAQPDDLGIRRRCLRKLEGGGKAGAVDSFQGLGSMACNIASASSAVVSVPVR